MDIRFLLEAGDLVRRYGLLGRDDWYSHKIGELREGESVEVATLAEERINMMEFNGSIVFFTSNDAHMEVQNSGETAYRDSFFFFDRKSFEADKKFEQICRETMESRQKFLSDNPWEGVKTLPSLLSSLELIPTGANHLRRKFYSFMKEIGLMDEMRRPTDKAVDMGYAVLVEEIEPWFEWRVDFVYSLLGWGEKSKDGYLSKTKLCRQHGIKYETLCSVLEPYSSSEEFYEPKPNCEAVNKGLARICRCFEWHPDCTSKICKYFLRFEGILKSEKGSPENVKKRLSWMGKKGMSPGEESPMSLLLEVDPECFERVNAIAEV